MRYYYSRLTHLPSHILKTLTPRISLSPKNPRPNPQPRSLHARDCSGASRSQEKVSAIVDEVMG
ncbi:50S ribosomal protein L7/L12 [Spatholobus suberectus]|nr:50S ribosomal protein L7/L12 [Spatholobus suberectus]